MKAGGGILGVAVVLLIVGVAWAGSGSGDSGDWNEGRLLVRERVAKDSKRSPGISVFKARKVGSGEVVLAERFRGPIDIDRFLRQGRYRLTSFTRPCRGDCSKLGKARDRCAKQLHMMGGIDRVTLVTDEGNPCRIRIRDHFCPSGELRAFNANRLVGMRVKRANATARRHECIVRVVRRDGESFPVTDDYRPDRINVAVEDSVVVRITGIG